MNNTQQEQKEQSYYQQRMAELGVTDENNTITVWGDDNADLYDQAQERKVFSTDQHDNIKILYTRIDGELIQYNDDTKAKKIREYKLTRLKVYEGGNKYRIPKDKGTFPFFPPELQKAYIDKTVIDTLFLTEGAFKAWKACKSGIMTVGLTSIHHYRDKESSKKDPKLHHDILLLIDQCLVKNVVILWDADCLDISTKDLAIGDELTRRPVGFFGAAKKIRALIEKAKPKTNPEVFFSHVRKKSFEALPKGLDDLLVCAEKENKVQDVVKAIHRLKDSYFFYYNRITKITDSLYKYFKLNKVEDFYQAHIEVIEDKQFLFWGNRYEYDNENDRLKMLAPSWARNTYMIGDEFFEEMLVPDARVPRKQLLNRAKQTLKARYGNDFQDFIMPNYFHGFCNVPSHFDYKKVVKIGGARFYNRYFPFEHALIEGKCELTLNFVKHIFGDAKVLHKGKEIASWEMGLDYIQLLLTNPMQHLPVLCLYSPENATGKSTFGELLHRIFKNNTIQIDNDMLRSEFGMASYADKLVVIGEETLLEKKKDVERIKMIATAYNLAVNPKGQQMYTISTFAKLIFMSNNPNMIYVTKHDERFWMLRIPQLPIDQRDPHMTEKLAKEIPHFVHYLKHRTLATEEEGRMWFNPALIKTDALADAIKGSEPGDVTELRQKLNQYFLSLEYDEAQNQLRGEAPDMVPMSTEAIIDLFLKGKSEKWVNTICKDHLKLDKIRTESGTQRVIRPQIPFWTVDGTTIQTRSYSPKTCWAVKKEDFLID